MTGIGKQIEQAKAEDYDGLNLEDLRKMIKDLDSGRERIIRFTTNKQGLMDTERKWFEFIGLKGEKLEAKMKELDELSPEGLWYYDGNKWNLIKR